MLDDRSRIIKVDIEDELKRAYMEYSMSVIVSRALPDVRDGLKPSQRRILYSMSELNLRPGGGFRKCAKIAGDTSGNYHPHGEQVVYPTLVRMAQNWNMRYPLIHGQGNFGSIDGDPPAAMRYTEAKLQKVSIDLLEDLEKQTVDFVANYDDTRREPSVFPSKFPNLLVNGSSGIAVGMATSIPPHNLGEVCDGICALVDNPDLEPLDMLKYIKGPDFPTGGYIIGISGIRDYFLSGKAKIKVRGKTFVETLSNGVEQLIVTEIPYQLNKNLLIEKIASLVKDKKITGIADIRDESGRQGMRLVIKLKKGFESEIILNQLYKDTQLQSTFSVINLALVDGIPQVINVKQMLQNFINFRHEVVEKRTIFELGNARAKLHLLEGYRIALDNIDRVIAIIRSSKSAKDAQATLCQELALSEKQAKAILEMRLQRLTGLEREKIEQDYKKTKRLVSKLEKILSKKELRMAIVKDETLHIKESYADERKSLITEDTGDIDIEDLIAEEDMVVTISKDGYIKRISLGTYRNQKRGGKGLTGSKLKDQDYVKSIFTASTHAYILFFTNFGKCYWKKVYELPRTGRVTKGKAIVNLLQMDRGESVQAYVTVKDFTQEYNIVMATRNGLIKKSLLTDFSHPRVNGIIAIKLIEGDQLIDAAITHGDDDILLATKNGYANRFSEYDVRCVGRNSQGVRGITLRSEDAVVSMIIIKREGTLLAVTENGFGKRTKSEIYRRTKRGSKGFITIKTTERNGVLVKMMEVIDEDDLIIVTANGIVNRQSAGEISLIGKNTQGVKLINLADDDRVHDITRVTAEDETQEHVMEVEVEAKGD